VIPDWDTRAHDTAGGTAPVLSVRGLTVRYPSTTRNALEGVALDLFAGELVGLVGLNGAGKSTLCRCLNGIIPQLIDAAVTGSVSVAGTDVLRTPVRRMAARIGVVFDDAGAQLSQGTVGEEVALGLESMAVPYAEMAERVADILARVGLDGMGERPPLSLSGGEKQRLLLACALVVRPAVLVLDEPTSGLDPRTRATVFDLLADVAARDGTAIIVAEHDVELLAERADRILVLREGRLVAAGTPAATLGDVPAMRAAGIRVPDAAAVAVALGGGVGVPVPVTFDEGLRWLEGRG
jgi:energy-coupling factor transport system ATP-binding protein